MERKPVTHKFVAVLNKKVPLSRQLNALAHMAAGLAAAYPDVAELRLDHYTDKDGGVHPNISDNPFIVLQAENSNKLRTLRQALLEHGIAYNDFLSTMVEGTFAEQHARTNQTPESELEYWGVCCFGPIEVLDPLTKKFSLHRG